MAYVTFSDVETNKISFVQYFHNLSARRWSCLLQAPEQHNQINISYKRPIKSLISGYIKFSGFPLVMNFFQFLVNF